MALSENGYEELVSLARFCLVTGFPYKDAKLLTDEEMAAFIEAWNQIQDEQNNN